MRKDRKQYVESKLSSNPGFEVLKDFDFSSATDLIDNVAEKASGVLVWTYLVTQSLLEGLSEGERLAMSTGFAAYGSRGVVLEDAEVPGSMAF